MPTEVYEVVAQAARYWFLLLMALIVWRSYRWFAKDRRQRKKRLKLLPDAGFIGELVVLKGNDELPAGSEIPISFEGVLGSVRTDDVCVPVSGVASRHLWYEYDEELGLRVEPFGRQSIEADGTVLIGRRKHAYLAHGSRLNVGDAKLRLRMFAGFEQAGAQHAAQSAMEEEHEQTEAAEQIAAIEKPPVQATGMPLLTPEQMLQLQQMQHMQRMQWMAAWQAQQAAMQSMTGAPANGATPMQGMPANGAMSAQGMPVNAAPMQGMPVNGVPMQGMPMNAAAQASAQPAVQSFDASAYMPPPEFRAARANAQQQDDFATQGAPESPTVEFDTDATFYPPVDDDAAEPFDDADTFDATGSWPVAPYPQSDVHFANTGYTDPEVVEDYEYADEDEAPRSLYVEPDEAEKAKSLVWDRYLKGGRHK